MTDVNTNLIQQAKDGHMSAASALVNDSIPFLNRVLYNQIPTQDLEDVVQSVIQRMLTNLERVVTDDENKFRGWLRSIANNVARDYWRSRYQRAEVEEPLPEHMDGIKSCYDYNSPDRKAVKEEEESQLRAAFDRLPENYQQALKMFYWDDMTVWEIAQALEKPTGTVQRWVYEGRQALRAMM